MAQPFLKVVLHLWTFKTPTRRRLIGHKGNVTLDIINVQWCKDCHKSCPLNFGPTFLKGCLKGCSLSFGPTFLKVVLKVVVHGTQLA